MDRGHTFTDGPRRSPKCRYHCDACGQHFASNEAFDAHRAGDYETGRYCTEADERFHGTPGICDIEVETTTGTVWGLAASRLRLRSRFGRMPALSLGTDAREATTALGASQ